MDPPSGNINTITIAWFIREFWKCSRVFCIWVPTFLLPSISKCVVFTVFLPTCVVGGLQKAQLNTLTFVGTLWSRRFPCCPVCSDLPSTKPLATHLLNSILCILPTREGGEKEKHSWHFFLLRYRHRSEVTTHLPCLTSAVCQKKPSKKGF